MQGPHLLSWRSMIIGVSLAALAAAGGCTSHAAPAAAPTAPPSPIHALSVHDVPTAAGTVEVAGVRCGLYHLPVHLTAPTGAARTPDMTAGRPEIYADQLGVQLCARSGYDDHPVQVLLADAADTHWYWQWPAPATSWVATAMRARPGWVTASIEVFGPDAGTQPPPGGWLTYDQMAGALHQLVTQLSGNTFGFHPLGGRVVTIGQGSGGYIAAIEAGRYRDVAGAALFGAPPDSTEPPLASTDAGSGYRRITDRCGGIDQAGAVAGACRTEQTLSSAVNAPSPLLVGGGAASRSPMLGQVTAPVLLVFGDTSCGRIACSSTSSPVRAACATFSKARTCGAAYPDHAGQLVLPARSADRLAALVNRWAASAVGAS